MLPNDPNSEEVRQTGDGVWRWIGYVAYVATFSVCLAANIIAQFKSIAFLSILVVVGVIPHVGTRIARLKFGQIEVNGIVSPTQRQLSLRVIVDRIQMGIADILPPDERKAIEEAADEVRRRSVRREESVAMAIRHLYDELGKLPASIRKSKGISNWLKMLRKFRPPP